MRRTGSIFILTFLGWQVSSLAQMDLSVAASLSPAVVGQSIGQRTAEATSDDTPQWRLTLGVIEAEARVLMRKNARLVAENDFLTREYNKLQDELSWRQKKNKALPESSKKSNGPMDQQRRIDELRDQINTKKVEVSRLKQELAKLPKKGSHRQQQASLEPDQQLNQQLKQEKDQEDFLQKQLADLKQDQPIVGEGQFKSLKAQLKALQKQKEQLQKKVAVGDSQTKGGLYGQLSLKKMVLEDKIQKFEVQLTHLRKASALKFSWSQERKQLIHQMTQADSHNIRLHRQVEHLRENIALLKNQVAILEYRKDSNDGSDHTK
ncbi:MAG: hypothetical protein HY209_05660 [Candidatus Omnitrophica bacterium]|nr:hypothetical protein [Candidatus Omnitrophota bacterium]